MEVYTRKQKQPLRSVAVPAGVYISAGDYTNIGMLTNGCLNVKLHWKYSNSCQK